MATALRPIGHEDRLTLVDHLDELRTRLIICVVALLACFAVTFWQSDAILDLVTEPVKDTQRLDGKAPSGDPLEQTARFTKEQREFYVALERALRSPDLGADERRALAPAAEAARQAARAAPTNLERRPVTLGVAEPFTTTISVALYAAILLALPLLLYQAYAFVLPAFTPGERRVALPLMLMVPVLFIGGVVFGYLVVLPRAVEFLQNFNDDSFDILLQARDYYRFAIMFLAAIGLLFQIPVGVLAVTRLGIVSPRQLRKNRGYVFLLIAVVAAVATPTPDPITMTLAMGPLIVLFELSIVLAAWLNRVRPPDREDEEAEPGPADDPLED